MISLNAALQILIYLAIIFSLIKPVGWYLAQVYGGKPTYFTQLLAPCERWVYRWCGINDQQGMDWKQYALALLLFNGLSVILVFIVQILQYYLPFNPQHLVAPNAWVAFNTAVSYVTNTDWQAYAGESTMSYLTQMLAFTGQNFLSAATGLAVLMALIRGLSVSKGSDLGNYWVDMVRGVLYVLLPLSGVLALVLVSQGVIQSLKPNQHIQSLQSITHHSKGPSAQQVIPMGPVASQIAIKQLGSNGGGFFNANGAHPFENPTPLTNFLEMLAILLIPAALTYTFGVMINDKRQGRALLGVMVLLFIPCVYFGIVAEQQGNPALHALGIAGGNFEGKEARFGIAGSVLWTVATSATSNGSVNSMLDSYTPIGGFIPLWLMHLGEVVFGGVGCGLYGMLMMVITAVFIGGLMVGRAPEYLGKKIETFDIKMASIVVLLMPICVLLCTAVSVILPVGRDAVNNPGMHGLTEILYAITSMMNNNGSAFSGLHADDPFYLMLGSFLMLMGRYGYIIPILALSGSLVAKPKMPTSIGTLTTHTPAFMMLLMAVIGLLGALSFVPVLALGPIAEHVMFWSAYGS
ncbi:MAG: potassium-transporting ATPase subunit KdpA [Legionella sp.]|nr:MAG: potassium-transporting ATPase subunit KdpA [Legionella sp.]